MSQRRASDELFGRHHKVVAAIYSPRLYFERCHAVLTAATLLLAVFVCQQGSSR